MPTHRRHCGACGEPLFATEYEAFSMYREPGLGEGLQLLYRFCPRCWRGIEAALREHGVDQVNGVEERR